MSSSSGGQSSSNTNKSTPLTATSLPPINRRSSTPLPGLSNTASSIRNRRSSNLPARSSLRRVETQYDIGEDDDEDGEETRSNGAANLKSQADFKHLEELKKGIIMPGMGGNRGNTEDRPGAYLSSSDKIPIESSKLQQAGIRDTSSKPLPGDAFNPALGRGRLPATLKASILKGRNQASSQSPATGAPKINKSIGSTAKGTPARVTRYSLPVRAEKPVRTSKTSGKHVMLPSESQLAPLPDEEGENDDDDDDDDEEEEEEESSESSDSDAEEGKDADDEDGAKDANESDKLQAKEETKKRREEAQKSLEEQRAEKTAQKMARKPIGAPGYSSATKYRALPTGSPLHALPPQKGPAHARAPPKKPKTSGPAYHTFERLAPSARVHTPLPRLTSYAVAPSIHLPTLIGFLRREHGVRPRLYDECVYVVYFKPLLPGFGRAEVRSAPEPAGGSPGGESRREREIVEREESGYVGGYFAATNKDDEGDHIDQQGYIMGGEGEGEGSDSRNRDRLEGRGDITENETDREGQGKSYDEGQISAAEASESEFESSRVRVRTPDGHTNGTYTFASEQEDETEEGMMTPRALEPRRHMNGDDYIAAQAERLLEETDRDYADPSETTPMEEQTLSKADVQGAMDLQHQQHMIESGQSEDGMFTTPRDVSSSRFDDDDELENRHRASPENVTSRRSRKERRRRSRDKQSRKERKVARPNTASHNHDTSTNMLTSRPILEALQVAELIILPYGVLVMYNLSAAEERSIINDVLSSGCTRAGLPYSPDDEETEAFHFCYDPTVPAPRIFNDFFTFRTSNHLLKLSLAHAIAQSTKLSVFEESMQRTLELTSHIPRELANSGELKLKRREALKLTGRLFKLRVDVNLTSNVLDTPELFWSEASLKALYDAIREYLEIDQRVENLNERLAVGNDLLEVIHDHIGSQAMNQITWIIIILIVVACIVACGEITARLVLHASQQKRRGIVADPDFELLRQLYHLSSRVTAGKAMDQAPQLLLN